MFGELKNFILRGNVLELAVAVIVADAFGSIIASLTNDVIMPPLGLLVGGIDFSDIKIVLQAAQGETPEVAIGIGKWLNSVFSFFILAAVLFYVTKVAQKVQKPSLDEATGPTQEQLLTEIRDLLKK
ncbi:MAG: large conductance mechanosensitive channel protein MscL [Saprospiraceae bacterium]|jgi:large conductance mechanosensitive channel|nr:large conductance mechanosensitive channel protein MscL [Saprospiraceae bacterium]